MVCSFLTFLFTVAVLDSQLSIIQQEENDHGAHGWLYCSRGCRNILISAHTFAQVTFTDVTGTSGTGLGETTTRGLAWVDFNKDGLLDLFVPTAGNVPNKLYKNNGDATFTEVAAAVGLNDLANTTTSTWADFDNDGDLDLLVTTQGASAKLWRNNLLPGGDTTFTDITSSAGISLTNAQMPTWTDYNLDGYLDFFSPVASTSSPDGLYRNNQDGTFTNVADSAGVTHQVSGISEQATHWGDYDRDGYPDLFIGSLTGQSFFHRNNGDGTFTEVAASMGFQGTARGVQWIDFNNDGLWDLSIAGYSGTTTVPVKLFKNNGNGTFTDVATASGISDPVISWGVTWADYDNNGYEDLFVDVFGQSTSCVLYRNNGDGTFTNVTSQAGLSGLTELSTVWGDFDGDGDMDLYGAGTGSTGNRLLRNNGDSTKHWLEVNLVGVASNRCGVGAQIEVHAGALHMMREVNTGVGYRSQNMLTAHFGLDTNQVADSIVVRWPGGAASTLAQVPSNQKVTVVEGTASVGESGRLPARTALFQNYPNPFNPSTRIRYSVAQYQHIVLSVVDQLGRLVNVLVDKDHGPGMYEAVFDASHLASGVYYYRLFAGPAVETRKLVLIR